MNTTETSGAHALDGTDPDQPQRTRLTRESWQWCNNAADDMRELQAMSESDLRHYCATPGGSRHNSISRGQ
jgi:hypothetical protein